jgi:hypothetical protein
MKELVPLSTSALTHLEAGQLIKRTLTDVAVLSPNNPDGTPNPINFEDQVVNNYLNGMANALENYELALVQIRKNDETEKIAAADMVRDRAIKAFRRAVKTFLLSDEPEEVLASKSLMTVLQTFKDVDLLNYQAESIALDNLVNDLQNNGYSDKVQLLNLGNYVERIDIANGSFKTLFDGRIAQTSMTIAYDAKQLRKEVVTIYNQFVLYVLSMARAIDSEMYNSLLMMVNGGRKSFADLLARRQGTTEEQPAENNLPVTGV